MTTVPAEFVAERNRVVRELRAHGDGDAAAGVAKLRRPAVTDWVLNVTAGAHPDVVADFIDAAEAMTAAQEAAMEGRDAGAVRVALPHLRERTAAVATTAASIAAREGHTGAGSSVAEISARMVSIATSATAVGLLRRGLLGAEDPDLVDPFGAGNPRAAKTSHPSTPRRPGPARSSASKAEPSPSGSVGAPKAMSRHDGHDELAARRAAARVRQRRAAEAALAATERSVLKRDAAVTSGRQVVAEAEGRLAGATADLDLALADLVAAERRRDEAANDLAATDES